MYSLEKNSYREITLRYTVWCRYNAVSFLTNIHERHPIAHPSGRGMGCLLWIQHQIDISLQLLMWYLIILDRVLTALDCIVTHIEIKYAPIWLLWSPSYICAFVKKTVGNEKFYDCTILIIELVCQQRALRQREKMFLIQRLPSLVENE